MCRRTCGTWGALLLWTSSWAEWGVAAEVFVLGNLGGPGHVGPTQIDAVSADGSTVVGAAASTLGYEAFRWTPAEGMQGLGDFPGGAFRSLAFDVSADGSVVVGRGTVPSINSPAGVDRAFRWTAAQGLQQFVTEELDVAVHTSRRVSRDGLVVFGDGTRRTGPGMFQTEPIRFRWTEASEAQAIDTLYPDYEWAFPISPDNGIWAAFDDFPVAQRQFSLLDVSGGAPQVLRQYAAFPTNVSPDPPGQEGPVFATHDATIVVGTQLLPRSDNPDRGVKQVFVDEGGQRTWLTSGDEDSTFQASTDEGGLLLGQTGSRPWVWTRAGGARSLLDYFVRDHGLDEDFANWSPTLPGFFGMKMSANGQTFAGQGTDKDFVDYKLVVRLSERLPGDANFDRRVDLADFGIVKLHFGSGRFWNEGNFDGDQDVDLSDFAILKENFGSSAAVPEPTGGVLAVLASAGLAFSRRGLASPRRRRKPA